MEIGIIKLVFYLIILIASIIALTAFCTGDKKNSKLVNSHMKVTIFMAISLGLGMAVMGSLIGVMLSVNEIGLPVRAISRALMVIAGVLIILLMGYCVLIKVKLKRKLKERYRTSDKS